MIMMPQYVINRVYDIVRTLHGNNDGNAHHAVRAIKYIRYYPR